MAEQQTHSLCSQLQPSASSNEY